MDLETFSIDIYDQPPHAIVLRLAGEFDIVSEPALQEALDSLCHRSGRPLLVDVSEAQFMGVGSLRRIVLAGRGFASTEFRSPVPIVEKVLRILGFIDGTVGIEGGALRAVAPCSFDEVASMRRLSESRRYMAENECPASRASQQYPDARGALKLRIVEQDGVGIAPATGHDGYFSQQSLEQK
jgi:anti-anti-sigma factor